MTKQDYIQLLISHDWTYQYSDDPSVYRRGQAQRDAINKVKAELGEDGQQLYDLYNKTPNQEPITGGSGSTYCKKVMCRNTGRIGNLIDKSPNGFMEVRFPDGFRNEFMRQSEVLVLG